MGGVQVARGYEGRVDLMVGRFVGVIGCWGWWVRRVYWNGDVVRWGCGGVLEFVGRTDFQVKVRGQRVELGARWRRCWLLRWGWLGRWWCCGRVWVGIFWWVFVAGEGGGGGR